MVKLFYRFIPKKFKVNKKNLKSSFKLILFIGITLVIVGTVFALGVFAYFAKDLPTPDKINQRKIVESTKIYDRTGTVLLYEVHGEEKRTIIPADQIPKIIKDATVAIEDKDFYQHHGFDFTSFIRAIFANLQGKRIRQGGSTITQQFIKNSVLTSEKTYTRKIKELILSLELERKFSKDEILSMYLNEIPYGSNSYGVESASQTFFGKPAKALKVHEAAMLAALPKAPTYYSPYGTHVEELKGRQEWVLTRMHELNYLNKEEMEQAKKEKLTIQPQREQIKAPHFVMYIKEYLSDKYGEEIVEQGGLRVITTLDWEKQQIAEEAVKNGIAKVEKRYHATNSALVAMDPKTGQILTMVGSRDYFDIERDGNVNVALMPRSPGSSFKPYEYAAAFKKGFSPSTILFDLDTDFGTDGRSYTPQNYDGNTRGPLTMRQSLAMSLNIPAVKTLYLAGINDTIDLVESFGITTLKDRERYGLALALGGGDVKLLEHVSAFTVFAADGVKHNSTPIIKVTNGKGKTLEEFHPTEKRVLEEEVARQISDVLSDNDARTPVFGPRSKLILPDRPVAAKTGTTQDYRDGWTMGFTPSLVTGVWVGNNRAGDYMNRGADGSVVAAPIWNEFMSKALKGTKVEEFTKPKNEPAKKEMLDGKFENEVTLKVDRISGKLATELTPPEFIEERTYKEVHSILYYVDKKNPLGDKPTNPDLDPQFAKWEAPVLAWAQSKGYNQTVPTEYDDVHVPGNEPVIEITSPKKGETIKTSTLEIAVSAQAPLGIAQVDFFLDDALMGTDNTQPYSITATLPFNEPKTTHKITLKAYDTAGNKKTLETEFTSDVSDLAKPEIILSPISAAEALLSEIELKATASDKESGIKKVDFYYYQSDESKNGDLDNNGSNKNSNSNNINSSPVLTPNQSESFTPKLIGSATVPVSGGSIYKVNWKLTGVFTGTIHVYAIATDNASNTQTSNEVSFSR